MFNRSGPGRQCFFMFALFSQNLIHDAAVGGGGRRAGGERVGGGGREASGLGAGVGGPGDRLGSEMKAHMQTAELLYVVNSQGLQMARLSESCSALRTRRMC